MDQIDHKLGQPRVNSFGRLRAVAVSVILSLAIVHAGAQAATPSFSISIELPNATLESGSPIRLDITIENHLNQGPFLSSNRTWRGAVSEITVLTSEGQRVGPLHKPQPGERQSGLGIGLGPHESSSESLNLGRFFDLTKPGKYSVQVKKRDPENNRIVESNIVTINITP